MKENLDKLRLLLLESSNEMTPLKVWQVQELSLQAAERIMSSPKEEALKVLTNIAQNFPLQVSKFTVISAFWLIPNSLQCSLPGCCSFGPDYEALPMFYCANFYDECLECYLHANYTTSYQTMPPQLK
jgi:hypothetical protein